MSKYIAYQTLIVVETKQREYYEQVMVGLGIDPKSTDYNPLTKLAEMSITIAAEMVSNMDKGFDTIIVDPTGETKPTKIGLPTKKPVTKDYDSTVEFLPSVKTSESFVPVKEDD